MLFEAAEVVCRSVPERMSLSPCPQVEDFPEAAALNLKYIAKVDVILPLASPVDDRVTRIVISSKCSWDPVGAHKAESGFGRAAVCVRWSLVSEMRIQNARQNSITAPQAVGGYHCRMIISTLST